jgi:hypothetical protein
VVEREARESRWPEAKALAIEYPDLGRHTIKYSTTARDSPEVVLERLNKSKGDTINLLNLGWFVEAALFKYLHGKAEFIRCVTEGFVAGRQETEPVRDFTIGVQSTLLVNRGAASWLIETPPDPSPLSKANKIARSWGWCGQACRKRRVVTGPST